MKYHVSLWNKKRTKKLEEVIIESDNNVGILLKGKIRLLSEKGIKFDKRKHDISFTDI